MAFGEIFYLNTDRAIGYESRWKYHIHVCEADYLHDHLFLFISKADYGGDMPLPRLPHHRFLPEPLSHVSFGEPIEIARLPGKKVGDLHPRKYQLLFRMADASRRLGQHRTCVLKAMHEALMAHLISGQIAPPAVAKPTRPVRKPAAQSTSKTLRPAARRPMTPSATRAAPTANAPSPVAGPAALTAAKPPTPASLEPRQSGSSSGLLAPSAAGLPPSERVRPGKVDGTTMNGVNDAEQEQAAVRTEG